ncbi:MAG: dTDP-4-dehydrorhamnose 3,5-epimerase [Sphingomonadaceae bacterium]|nr:dTDP-4-dehydrorhamnose 3,5-epimerase [Sphingomonadaceae bacterium]
MKVTETKLPSVVIIEPQRFGDERGFFLESWNARTFDEHGLSHDFVQDNHSRSAKGVLRGLHFQKQNPQGKLVRVTRGRAFDVAIDIRPDSQHYREWVGIELSEASPAMFYIPEGFAHGFLSLEDGTDFLYKCTTFYDPADEGCIVWNDPEIGIDWPLDGIEPIVSAKDAAAPTLAQYRAED